MKKADFDALRAKIAEKRASVLTISHQPTRDAVRLDLIEQEVAALVSVIGAKQSSGSKPAKKKAVK